MNVPALRKLLSACDLNKPRRLEYEDISCVCLKLNELNVSFNKFDFGEVGHVDCNDFSARCNEESEDFNLHCVGEIQKNAWEEFEETLDASYLGGLKEQLAKFYLQLCSSADGSLLQQYETLVRALVSDSQDHVLQNHKLETIVTRVEEQATSLLIDLEEKLQQQMDHREERVQEEEQRLKAVVASVQRKHDSEVKELQAVVDRLMKENAQLKNSLNNVNISRGRGILDEYSSTDSGEFRMELKEYQHYSHTSSKLTKQTNERTSPTVGPSDKMVTAENKSVMEPCQPLQRLQFTWPADEDLTAVDTSYSEINSDSNEDSMEAFSDLHRPPENKMSSRVLQRLHNKRLLSFPSKLEDTSFSESDDPIYKLVLAGDTGSGKSSFLLRLSTHEFKKDPQSTVGVECKVKKMVVDGKQTTLHIWDTAGQERFRSLTRSYFHNVHGIFLLYDITCKSSFLNIRQWMEQIEESVESPVPMCIIGNKADLRSELPEGSCVTTAQGERLAMVYNTLFCETSAKEGTNVVEAVLHLARVVKKSTQSTPAPGCELVLSQVGGQTRTVTSCCLV